MKRENDEKLGFWTGQSHTTVCGKARAVWLVRTWSARSCVQQARQCVLRWLPETWCFACSGLLKHAYEFLTPIPIQ